MIRLTLLVAVLSATPAAAESSRPSPAPDGARKGDPARALVDKWLAAQNAGDFAAYETLYADRFTGIRRSGPRTVKLDRAHWMKDRKRMFGKKMTVAVSDFTVAAAGKVSTARFTQTWASGGYKDVGPKLLVIVDGRIAREELLQSTRLGGNTKSAAHLFVADAGAVVLDTDFKDEPAAWRSRDAKEIDGIGTNRAATHALVSEKVSARAREWIGKKVRLFNDTDEKCVATIVSLRVTARWGPHFGLEQEWRSQPARVVANAIYEGPGDHWLEGVLDKPCDKHPTWARAADLPVPVFTVAAYPALREAAAVAAFRALPEYTKLQNEFVAWIKDNSSDASGRWEDYDKAEPPSVQELTFGKQHFLSVGTSAGQGCSDYQGSLWALFSDDGSRPTLIGTLDRPVHIVATVDIDGDGIPEFLLDSGEYVAKSGARYDLYELHIPNYDCPC
jgi:hypothetical protein